MTAAEPTAPVRRRAPGGRWFRLRTGGLAAIAALLLLTAVGAVLVLVAVHDVSTDVHENRMHYEPASADVQRLLSDLINQETGERGYLLTADRAYLAPYIEGRTAAAVELADLRRLAGRDRQLGPVITEVARRVHEWQAQAAQPEIGDVAHGEQAAAIAHARLPLGKRDFDSVRVAVAQLQGLIEQRSARAAKAVDVATGRLRLTVLIAVLLSAAAAVLASVALRRWVLAPIYAFSRALRRVADGDLQAPVAIDGPAEMVALAGDADLMRSRLVDALDESRRATEALQQRGPVVAALAQQLQPTEHERVPGLRVAGVLQPAEGVLAGDWWDTVQLSNGHVAFLVADVSGHGPTAGLEAFRLKQVLTSLLAVQVPARRAVETVSRGFAGERFATALVIEVDPASGRVQWVNAGHPPPLVVPAQDAPGPVSPVRRLDPTGPLLSSLGGAWSTRSTQLHPGEVLLAYTDGLVESADERGEQFGVERVLDVLAGLDERDPQSVVTALTVQARRFRHGRARDDVTVLALSWQPDEQLPAGGRATRARPATRVRGRRSD